MGQNRLRYYHFRLSCQGWEYLLYTFVVDSFRTFDILEIYDRYKLAGFLRIYSVKFRLGDFWVISR